MNEKDFKDFYPSVKEKLLWEAIRFTNRDMSITGKKIVAIFMQGNPFYIPTINNGSKKEKAALMLQWAHTMRQRYVN